MKGDDNMATSTKVQTSLVLKFKTGVNKAGKDIIKEQSFSGVKVNAVDDDIYAVADSIGNLLQYPVVQILKSDESAITQTVQK